jgi:signal transduction histidine kinase/CheY-like chemotaxis protein
MVLASYFFGVRLENEHLEYESQLTTDYVEARLSSNLKETETLLGAVSETVRGMLISGQEYSEVAQYIVDMTDYGIEKDKSVGFVSIFAMFETERLGFTEPEQAGVNGSVPDFDWAELLRSGDYVPEESLWYSAAVKAEGEIVATEPYIDTITNKVTFTHARAVYDNNGERLAIVCLDVTLDQLYDFSVESESQLITDWVLLDSNLNVIAHYDQSLFGVSAWDIPGGMQILAEEISQGNHILGRRLPNHVGESRIISVRELENGWYLAVSSFADNYLRNINTIQWFLTILGFIMAAGLSVILISIVMEKNKAEIRTRKLLEEMDTLIMVTEIDNDNIIFINDKMKSDFELTDTVVGEKCWKIIYGIDVRCGFCPKNNPLLHEGESVVWDRFVPSTGKHYKSISRIIDWPGGKRVYMQQFDDVTKIREAEEYAQLLLDATPLACILWSSGLQIIDCNSESLDIFDLKSKNDLIENFYKMMPELQPDGKDSKEASRAILKKALDKGYYHTEWVYKLLNGNIVPCEVTIVRVKYKDNYMLAVYIRDLREQKAYIDEVDKAREVAENANRIKSIFLANMSHEIRTPMNSIIGFAELAQFSEIPPKAKEYIENISESAGWLLNIINDILDISKIESGKIELEYIPFDLRDILEHCQSIIMSETEIKGISLYCYAEPSVGGKLIGDPVRLRQALMNLLSNAVKFTTNGLIKMLVSVKNSTDKNVTLDFEIKDSGIGMTDEQIVKIFDPFTQADDSVTRRFGGTGLGLAITKNIIELMGGRLYVESTVGVGSKFSFALTFDLVDDASSIPIDDIKFNDFEKPNFKGEILICEDNLLNQKVICDHLRRVGVDAVVASNGQEALDIITEREKNNEKMFDLIFMDIHMPVMDGIEAACEIKKLGLDTPIVAMTANIMTSDLEIYKQNGMTDYLGKPFKSQRLWKCLVKFLPVEKYTPVPKQSNEIEESNQEQLKLIFVQENQDTLPKIVEAIEKKDIKSAHRMAHTLKSNAGQIGKSLLQSIAGEAEEALSNGENRLTREKLSLLEVELSSVLDELSPYLEKFNEKVKKMSEDTPPITDESMIQDLFGQLLPLIESNDTECMVLLDDIRRISGTDELVVLIEEYDFKKAIKTLKELMKRNSL